MWVKLCKKAKIKTSSIGTNNVVLIYISLISQSAQYDACDE
jgi:hypothetical protein